MQNIGDEPRIALIYGNLGFIYQNEGNVVQAMTCYKQALLVLERIGDKHNSAILHNNLGLLYFDQSQFAEARVHLLKAKELYEMIGDNQGVWNTEQELQRL